MKDIKGNITSIYNGTALDGPGIRCIVFLSGCNMRCPFCHNPETFYENNSTEYTAKKLYDYLIRYKNYIKNGGVTFSGGEPFLQSDFCIETIKLLKKDNISVAIETNCSIINKDLIKNCDIIIADVKNYKGYIENFTKDFLKECQNQNKNVILTNVIIKGVNDNIKQLKELKNLTEKYNNITKIDFLPFKKFCLEKYEKLNLPFLYKDKQETNNNDIEKIKNIFNKV